MPDGEDPYVTYLVVYPGDEYAYSIRSSMIDAPHLKAKFCRASYYKIVKKSKKHPYQGEPYKLNYHEKDDLDVDNLGAA